MTLIYLLSNLVPWLLFGLDPLKGTYYAPRVLCALGFLFITRLNVITIKNCIIILILFSLVISYGNIFAPRVESLLPLSPFFRFFFTYLPPVPVLAYYITGPRWAPLFTLFSLGILAKAFYDSLGVEVTFTLTAAEHSQFFIIAILVQVLPMTFLVQFENESVLYHTLLLASLKEVEQKSRAKTTFISRMSHELRTPLQGLLSSVALLRDTPLGEDQVTFMTLIDSSGELLLSIVEKILDITRIESSRFDITIQPFNLLTLVPAVMESVVSIASTKGLELHLHFSLGGASSFEVEGDAKHLRGILVNLVGNAIKFTEHGSVSVFVSSTPRDGGSSALVRFEVHDTGRGMPERILPNLFEPFTKAHNYHQSEGSGLGLSIVKRFAEAMGGSVGVTTKLGVGSRFWVEIPFRVVPTGSLGPSPLLLPAQDRVNPTFGIFSQHQTLATLIEYLTFFGIPYEVLDDLGTFSKYSHIIVDTNSPGVTGPHAFADAIRGGLRLIYLSPFTAHTSTKAEFERDGGPPEQVALISCPLTPAKLTRALKKVLRAQRAPSHQDDESDDDTGSSTSGTTPRVSCGQISFPQSSPDFLDVLLVEDNSVNQLVMRKLFEKLGVSFEITGSAEGSLEIWKRRGGHILLILMDVELEGPMTGLEATAEIRKMEKELAAPRSFIGIMTGRSLEDDRRAAEKSGSDEFLVKPVVFEKIRDLINLVVTRTR